MHSETVTYGEPKGKDGIRFWDLKTFKLCPQPFSIRQYDVDDGVPVAAWVPQADPPTLVYGTGLGYLTVVRKNQV